MKETDKKHPPLDRASWIAAAMTQLSSSGMDGVRVEILARQLKVTKGSFYWHFKDRAELIEALLENWRESRISDIEKQSRSEPGKELDALLHVIDVYGASKNQKGILIELALREWAKRDRKVSAYVADVDRYRLARARALFIARGFSEAEAQSRSVLLYAYVFGYSLMNGDQLTTHLKTSQADIRRLITR